MPDDVVAARGAVIQVSNGATPTPAWLPIHGLTSFVIKDSEGTKREESTTWDDAGKANSRVMERGASIELGWLVKRDTADADLDAGQARLIALGRGVLGSAQGQIRYREHEDLDVWEVWDCNVDLGDRGGELNKLAPGGCTIMRCGAETTMAVT